MSKEHNSADFTINSAPVSISFECPHCGAEVRIPWRELNPPEYWGDKWDPVTCPDCNEEVELEDYEYD